MTDDEQVASEETPDKIMLDLTGLAEVIMTHWQLANACKSLRDMSIEAEQMGWAGAFTLAQYYFVEKVYNEIIAKQSEKVQTLIKQHDEDIAKGKEEPYKRVREKWEQLERGAS